MFTKNGFAHELLVDVHADAHINATRLADRRWRISVLLVPRSSGAWWVDGADVTVSFGARDGVTAVAADADGGEASEPKLLVADEKMRALGYGDQTSVSVSGSERAMSYSQFDFTVDPDVTDMRGLGFISFWQNLDQSLHGAVIFRTDVPFGTEEDGSVVLGQPVHEVWCSEFELEPGQEAGEYWTYFPGEASKAGLPCGHDWCNGEGEAWV